MPPYTPVTVDRFGGLNLRDDPIEVGLGQATAMDNVDIDHHGRLRTRDGYLQIANTTTGASGAMAYYNPAGQEYIVTGVSTNAVPIAIPSGSNGSSSAGAPPFHNGCMTPHGTPTSSRLYLVNGTTTMRKLTGTTWANVTIPIAATTIAVTADNRLIVGDQDGNVAWSDPEDPDVWGSTDTQALAPGQDDFGVTSLITWRELTFAFKADKFFVISGFSIDGDGGTLLEYRPVTAGQGVPEEGQACAGDEGVYFVNHEGVYLTQGDTPALISGMIGFPVDLTYSRAPVYWQRRLYVLRFGVVYVFDVEQQAWLTWNLASSVIGMCVVPQTASTAEPGIYFTFSSGRIMHFSTTATHDGGTTGSNGNDIIWTYTSGFSDLGSSDRKVVREIVLWGFGGAFTSIGVDMEAPVTVGTISLGFPVAFGRGTARLARRGTFFQYVVSLSQPSTIHRVVFQVRDKETPK